MNVSWAEVSVLVSIVGMFTAVTLLAIKTMLRSNQTALDNAFADHKTYVSQKFQHLERVHKEVESRQADAEKSLLQLKAELPDKYVQREDFIRVTAVIEAKQDTLAERVGNMGGAIERMTEILKGLANER